MTRPTGSSKYGTTRKNTQRYYTTKRLIRYISSAIADHMTQIGHRIKWDHFDIVGTGQSDKIKETLLIRDLKPALNENVGSENFFSTIHLYFFHKFS